MNINLTELDLIGVQIVGHHNNAASQNSVLSQMWSVITFERTGDALRDPYRTATGFFHQGRATDFANAFRSLSASYCVLLCSGTQVVSVVAGDSALLELWRARTGTPSPAPGPNEIADVTAEAVSPDPAPIADGGDYTDVVDPDDGDDSTPPPDVGG